jgi:hypothetical protein
MNENREAHRIKRVAFYASLVATFVLAYRIAQPFLIEVGWAIVFGICFEPRRRDWRSASVPNQRCTPFATGRGRGRDRAPRDLLRTARQRGRGKANRDARETPGNERS